jgi:hypothetical protein
MLAGLVGIALSVCPGSASAERHKAIWGPLEFTGASLFPTYKRLGVGIYQMSMSWAAVAPTRPANPRDQADPAYVWPTDIDRGIAAASRRGIRLSLLISHAPGWANGGRSSIWAPQNPGDFADFAVAASRRYPGIRYWMLWGEPSKANRFQPLAAANGRCLSARQRRGPRRYARILDSSYAALKHVDRRDFVIGGNTWTSGDVSPLNFIRAMRLPSGRRPRMDLYGHNPFSLRLPDLREEPLSYGTADFSDLDTLARWLDRYGYRNPRGRRLKLFLSELTIPTDHANFEFNFWVTRETQARWLGAALRITRRYKRIYTLGYLGLFDDSPRPDGLEVNRGLLTWTGARKPAYYTFRRG